MPTWLIIILLAILAVGLFVLAMSLTLIFKGHHIDSEISTNENMRKLGIKCAVQETREQMAGLEDCASEPCVSETSPGADKVSFCPEQAAADRVSRQHRINAIIFLILVSFPFSRAMGHCPIRLLLT